MQARTHRQARAARRRAALAGLLLLGGALLGGCCGGAELVGASWDEALHLQPRRSFALVAPVLDDPRAWGYGEPRAAVAALASSYCVAPVGSASAAPSSALLPPAEAPEPLRAALARARAALESRGYRLAGADEAPDFVLSLALTTGPVGPVRGVAIYVGARVEGAFDPQRAAFVAELPAQDACSGPVELIEALVGALPPHDPQGER
ncbi:MAG: hypothetical protein AB7N76_36120 [Planctomycetota bacterium]